MKKIAIIVVALLILSCDKEEQQQRKGNRPIGFTTEVVQTKSGFVGSAFADGDVIGVMGYELPDGTWDNNEFPNLMYDAKLTRKSATNYAYDPQKMWPNAPSKARFFAYYPYSGSLVPGAVAPSLETHNGYPYVKVVLGKDVSAIDFLAAQTDVVENGANDNVKFRFNHKLSKIMFMVKATGLETTDGSQRNLYINNVVMRNVYNKSVYMFDAAGGAWDVNQSGNEGVDASSGATIGFSSVSASIGSDWQNLTDPLDSGVGAYVLMIPQTYDNVELEVSYTVERTKVEGGCEDHISSTKKAQLSVQWKAGMVYTYYIELAFGEIKEDLLMIGFDVKPWEHRDIYTVID